MEELADQDPQLNITHSRHGDVALVTLEGRFAGYTACHTARDACRQPLEKGEKALFIHLGDVRTIDSGGLGVLAEIAIAARNRNSQLRLVAVPESVRHLLEITKLLSLFEMQPDLDAASSSLGSPEN